MSKRSSILFERERRFRSSGTRSRDGLCLIGCESRIVSLNQHYAWIMAQSTCDHAAPLITCPSAIYCTAHASIFAVRRATKQPGTRQLRNKPCCGKMYMKAGRIAVPSCCSATIRLCSSDLLVDPLHPTIKQTMSAKRYPLRART